MSDKQEIKQLRAERDALLLELECFRWLTDDIKDHEERQRREALLQRMSVMSHSAVVEQIKLCINEAVKRGALATIDTARKNP